MVTPQSGPHSKPRLWWLQRAYFYFSVRNNITVSYPEHLILMASALMASTLVPRWGLLKLFDSCSTVRFLLELFDDIHVVVFNFCSTVRIPGVVRWYPRRCLIRCQIPRWGSLELFDNINVVVFHSCSTVRFLLELLDAIYVVVFNSLVPQWRRPEFDDAGILEVLKPQLFWPWKERKACSGFVSTRSHLTSVLFC